MPPTSRAVRDEVDNFLSYLLDAEIALHANPVTITEGRVTWAGLGQRREFLAIREERLAAYRAWLESGAYSALLFDGALLQISYDFAGHQLIGHRLVWVPCPLTLDRDLLQIAPALEVFDMYANDVANVVLRAALRFDFDLLRTTPEHPTVHLSLNAVHCRIACAAPLRLGHFADFVFRNFYPALWRSHPYLDHLSKQAWDRHLVTEEESQRPHVSWLSV